MADPGPSFKRECSLEDPSISVSASEKIASDGWGKLTVDRRRPPRFCETVTFGKGTDRAYGLVDVRTVFRLAQQENLPERTLLDLIGAKLQSSLRKGDVVMAPTANRYFIALACRLHSVHLQAIAARIEAITVEIGGHDFYICPQSVFRNVTQGTPSQVSDLLEHELNELLIQRRLKWRPKLCSR